MTSVERGVAMVTGGTRPGSGVRRSGGRPGGSQPGRRRVAARPATACQLKASPGPNLGATASPGRRGPRQPEHRRPRNRPIPPPGILALNASASALPPTIEQQLLNYQRLSVEPR